LQKNVDEAVQGLKAKGITAVGAVCHVSNAQQRKDLIDTAVKVRIGGRGFQMGVTLHSQISLVAERFPSGQICAEPCCQRCHAGLVVNLFLLRIGYFAVA
jgi:hypothetical protein